MNLRNKTAIVTGGIMGIGKSIVEHFVNAGANVLIADIVEPQEAEKLISEFNTKGNIRYIQADLRETENCAKVIDTAVSSFGDLDILVNNAGIFKFMPVLEMTEQMWDDTLNLNLKSVAFLSKLAAKEMIEKGEGGRIINISSVDSFKPTGNLSHYDASKGGLRIFTKALAKELGQYGITVNDIAPGGVATPGVQQMSGKTLSEEEQKAAAAQNEIFTKSLPLQRMGEPDDIGGVALFLASDYSKYMTGSTLVVDGGLMIM